MPNQRQIRRAFDLAYEKNIRKAERKSYRKAYKVYQDAFKAATDQFIKTNVPESVSLVDAVQFRKLFEEIYTEIGVEFAKWYRRLFERIATKNDTPELSIWQMAMAEYGRKEAGELVSTVQESMRGQFLAQIRREFQDPEFMALGTEQQAARLRKRGYWSKQSRFMAMRVARTESNKAANLGIERSSRSMFEPHEMEKQWITARDEKVRPGNNPKGIANHRVMEGRKIPFDADFEMDSGVKLRRPGIAGNGQSPRGQLFASEVINCRCRVVDIPKEDLIDNLFDDLMSRQESARAANVQTSDGGFITSNLISALFGR